MNAEQSTAVEKYILVTPQPFLVKVMATTDDEAEELLKSQHGDVSWREISKESFEARIASGFPFRDSVTQEQINILKRLIEAAKPFTSGDVVTETSGTIPLMEELEDAILAAEQLTAEREYPTEHATFREFVNDEMRKYLATQ